MPNFMPRPQDPCQIILFPVSVEAAVPADCDVRLVGEAMDQLGWGEFEAQYAETGRPPYPPREMCKLLVYGYARGMRSSRALEEAARFDQRFIWLLGGLQPDHSKICRFRREHERQLRAVFQATVRLCVEAGLVLLRVTATDGSKVPARASRRSLYNAKRVAREQAAIDQILAEAEAADRAEEEQAGGPPGGSLPEELADAQRRREKLAEVAARLAKSGGSSISATEPECRVMKTSQGLLPGYNVQTTVDAAQEVILAAEVTAAQTDSGQLLPQLAQVAQNTGLRPDVALADTGYSDEGTFAGLAQGNQEALLPPREQPQQKHDRNNLFSSRCFVWEPRAGQEMGVLVCPAGQELTFRGVVRGSSGDYRVYRARNCRACSFFAQCVKPPSKTARSVQVSIVGAIKERIRQRLKTAQGKAAYRLRQQVVEPVFAQLKWNRGLNRFRLPGLQGARAELWLACIAHNLLVYARNS